MSTPSSRFAAENNAACAAQGITREDLFAGIKPSPPGGEKRCCYCRRPHHERGDLCRACTPLAQEAYQPGDQLALDAQHPGHPLRNYFWGNSKTTAGRE